MKVAVIGAGPSGLAAIRICLQYGLQPICFESESSFGGLWRFKPESNSVMKTTIFNTHKETSAFSDFPPPSQFANFMHNTEYLKYLKLYAENFDLLRHVKFNSPVQNIRKAGDYEATGKYSIHFIDGHNERAVTVDAVLCCTGNFSRPNVPEFEGQKRFRGKIVHSAAYKSCREFEEQTIAIVGSGNSAADVAVEQSRASAKVYLLTRSGFWHFPRLSNHGYPSDIVLHNRVLVFLIHLFPSILNWFAERAANAYLDHTTFGLKPSHKLMQGRVVINDDLRSRILTGKIEIRAGVAEFAENGLILTDGSKIENLDGVILATGYSLDYDKYLVEIVAKSNPESGQYLHMYPMGFEHDSLALIGRMHVSGSIFPVSEMQCRLFCEVLTGRVKLPSQAIREKNIGEKRLVANEKFVGGPWKYQLVQPTEYSVELAAMFGAKPDIVGFMLKEPRLALKLAIGPILPYQYRLNGSQPWSGARGAIFGVWDRCLVPIQTRRPPHIETEFKFSKLLFFLIVAVFVIYVLFLLVC